MLNPAPVASAAVLTAAGSPHAPLGAPGERLHHLFEQRCDALQAQGQAAHRAVDGATALTYAELDARANRLARHLLALGHGPGDVIALLFDKSADSYAAMLAVLKIHAAYVPLDAGFPADRIAYIVADAGAQRVLSLLAYEPLLAACAAPVCAVDALGPTLDALDGTRLRDDELGPPTSELCYVIYTSGSTGRPKGVPIDHAQILNFVRVAAGTYGYRRDDRVYQGLTLAFDFAVEEIWVPLAVGATLLPNQTGGSLLGADLARFLVEHRITALCCVPTLLATLDEELPALRLLIVSGEACPRDLVQRWHRPGRVFLNAYGPTETTVTATLGRPQPGRPVTIGTPLPTYSIVILEPGEARALPFGAVGEIGIAGIGVARGYLGREEQTRKAFIPDFLGIEHNTSGRIYRTGDLGRINEHGEVEYLGRIDTQVKIRGYRIELAEIESVLLQQPGVAQAVVNTHESGPGVVELVAYYTAPPGQPWPQAEALARGLRERLPSYMVPAFYEPLARMPMLASDKADRRALPPPQGARLHASSRSHVAPSGDAETLIAAELAALLGLEQVSADDDFFADLGANSLLMARFGARLRTALGHERLSMRELYAHPSVRQLGALLQAQAPADEPVDDAVQVDRRAPHVASRAAYLACGAAQTLLLLAFAAAHATAWWVGWHWMNQADGMLAMYRRAVGFAVAYFLAATLLPVGLKWLLAGRMQAAEFPVWSLRYLRFWAVKALIRGNPMVAFAGTPLMVAYLRLLGARVAWSAQVGSLQVNACPDLLHVGEGSVLSAHSLVPGYRAEGGRVRLAPIVIGKRCHVGEGSLVDIDTVLGDGSELAHASSVLAGQRLPPGRPWHGCPAQVAPGAVAPLSDHDVQAEARGEAPGPARRLAFSAAQLGLWWLIGLPLPLLAMVWLAHQALAAPGLPALLGAVWSLQAALLLGALALAVLLPSVLGPLLEPGRVYPLYGVHHALQRLLRGGTNRKFFNVLFGDSSAIVHYLRAIGFRFPRLQQTGSNFGQLQEHDHPGLCTVGSGSMVSDGIHSHNAEFGRTGLRLREVRLGARSFFGNSMFVPAGHRLGDDCLLATKVMLPLHGPVRSGVGLLGSPPFEIPRSVRRDSLLDTYGEPAARAARLRLKNRYNTGVALAFLAAAFVHGAVWAVAGWLGTLAYGGGNLAGVLVACAGGFVAHAAVLVLQDRWAHGWRRLQPRSCSIYDDYFWFHERCWKLGLSSDHPLLAATAGTPWRGLMWRLLGARIGRQLFDDGCAFPEKSLVEVGDHCTLAAGSALHTHSLEDGAFKSDRIVLGRGCSVGANAFVHYGARLAEGSRVQPDAFLMKGEQVDAGAVWQGNSARPLAVG